MDTSKRQAFGRLKVEIEFEKAGQPRVMITLPPRNDPYSLVVGRHAEEVPEIIARQFGAYPNPHLLCSLAVCRTALGIFPLSKQMALIEELVLAGITIRDHGLHLNACIRAGLLQVDDKRTEYLAGLALLTACFGMNVEVTFGGTWREPHLHLTHVDVPDFEVAEMMTGLSVARRDALELVQAFLPVHFQSKNRELLSYRSDILHRLFHDPFSRSLNKTLHELRHLFYKESTDFKDYSCLLKYQAVEIVCLLDRIEEWLDRAEFSPEEPIRRRGVTNYSRKWIEAPRGGLCHELRVNEAHQVEHGKAWTPTAGYVQWWEKALAFEIQETDRATNQPQLEARLTDIIRAFNPCGFDVSQDFVDFVWK